MADIFDEIVKERLVMWWDGVELVIDRFLGALAGLVLAEIELGPDDPLRDPPAGAVADVTHDDRYSGGALARSASGRQEGTPWTRPTA